MPRGRDRKDIVDFSYGMDSTSHPNVISDQTTRFPLLQNFRVNENGKLAIRKAYTLKANSVAGGNALLAFKDLGVRMYYGYDGHTVSGCSIRSMDFATLTEASVKDLKPTTPNDLRLSGYGNFAEDGTRLFVAGFNSDYNPAVGKVSGAIIDSSTVGRSWGIIGPAAAPTVSYASAANPIPAPTATITPGWYYAYSYIYKVGAEVLAESALSAIPASRLTYSGPQVHTVGVVASTDPQVTNIRIYRTTGDTTGLEDGTDLGTLSWVKDVDNTSATVTCNSTETAAIANVVTTFDHYAYNASASPKPARGVYCVSYKQSILVYGYDNFVYFTDNLVGAKYKTLFNATSYIDCYAPVKAVFVHKNDIVICTVDSQGYCKTYVITDGIQDKDTYTPMRLMVDGIGCVAPNTVSFDGVLNRTIALTNQGVKTWDGTGWSDDKSYQIKNEMFAAASVAATENYVPMVYSVGKVINREYFLSIRGSLAGGTYNRTFVAFLNNDGSFSWTKDMTAKACFMQGGIAFNSGFGWTVARVNSTGTTWVNYLVTLGELSYYGDFGSDDIACSIQLPRLIHGTIDNNVRLRYVKVFATLGAVWASTDIVPKLYAVAKGDGGKTYQKEQMVNDHVSVTPFKKFTYSDVINSINAARFSEIETNNLTLSKYYVPVMFEAHFDSVFGKASLDVTLSYTGKLPFELNGAVIFYNWRDILKEVQIQE